MKPQLQRVSIIAGPSHQLPLKTTYIDQAYSYKIPSKTSVAHFHKNKANAAMKKRKKNG